ncbi:hypothetical protein VSDG_03585 [Cytospora chrysosperma]|uniref:Uncharacterized protein n=1 Tax=Cytospora chrysosperma TaxID=252740 RepID=A0A423W9V6_CYTCH|nr:hypothetical protein VSDG_03585 [Valsa sordida]
MDSNQVNSALQQLSAVARNAYDKYGRLDLNRVQLLVRGFYLSQEEAAALPSRITEHFPGKSQKACQEKFYHAVKDPDDHKWKHYHHDLRREHDEKKHK